MMKNWLKSRNIRSWSLLLVAVVIVSGVSVRSAISYFTTFASARGGYPVKFSTPSIPDEKFQDWTKSITITNEETSIPVYVRAKAFSGSTYPLTLISEVNGDWTLPEDYRAEGDAGYAYYNKILMPGAETDSALVVKISGIPEEDKVNEGDNFDVIIIYETVPVYYDENGDAKAADWTGEVKTMQRGGN